MLKKNVDLAVLEAQKFLTVVEASREEWDQNAINVFVPIGKRSGALRRSSMDLTRALAKMRKWM